MLGGVTARPVAELGGGSAQLVAAMGGRSAQPVAALGGVSAQPWSSQRRWAEGPRSLWAARGVGWSFGAGSGGDGQKIGAASGGVGRRIGAGSGDGQKIGAASGDVGRSFRAASAKSAAVGGGSAQSLGSPWRWAEDPRDLLRRGRKHPRSLRAVSGVGQTICIASGGAVWSHCAPLSLSFPRIVRAAAIDLRSFVLILLDLSL
ncbi:hypothetical protein CBR_g28679 [Chara braunii]|uniref:Uncharacterized protein n=1 Tax=Chara braunii TaxID=69332 RepID=A0A388L9H9_CHABU|nr:hypothetical protein CBR_g28679 [Chara braunii]|eukprot:GBG78965.1 hypothetical protein CBR_g28679 [Chara braunii]